MKEENKSKKLEEKVNTLIEKIEKEESKIKRLGYVIKCKMLVAKLERQIKFQNAKEDFKKQKEENGITAAEEKVNSRSKIITLSKKIKQVEAEIRANSEYDFLSSKFIFPEEEVEKSGGIKKYTEELRSSGRPEQEETAQKIEENIERRKELKKLKEQLEEQQEQLNNADKALKSQNKKISRKETALTIKSKFNFFAGIRNFASSVTNGVKEFFAETMGNRKINKEKVEKLDELQDAYWKMQDKIREEYEEKMKKLDEKREELEGKIKDDFKEERAEQSKTSRTKQALEFQERLQKITKEGSENKESKEEEGLQQKGLEEDSKTYNDDNGKDDIGENRR